MFQNKSVNLHQFAMVPRADIPRSTFKIESMHKTTFDGGYLVPVFIDELLPGDHAKVRMTAFARLSTPIFPVMDNLHLDSFFFFVPNRLVWNNWVKMMGEQTNPGDSTSYIMPTCTSPASGYAVGSLQDYFGLPTVGQLAGANTYTHTNLPMRCYNLIWNEWFRDENLQNSVTVDKGDGPDTAANYVLLRRGKRHDYITSVLPWTQKGNPVSVPLGTRAPIMGLYAASTVTAAIGGSVAIGGTAAPGAASISSAMYPASASAVGTAAATAFNSTNSLVYADLSTATAATINQLRQAFQIQKLLERDARGGTRYVEQILAHYGVVNPDFRLARPEYLGGGTNRIVFNPIAQTSGSGASGTTAPLGNLAAMATSLSNNHGFTYSATEHGYVIGLVNVRADLTYQQGVRKLWNRSTRYDFYTPEFAMLGEQSVLNKELYADGSANDNLTFGYQERWAEYRYQPSIITGLFKSTAAGTIDNWHLAQKFTTLPTLNSTFIEDNPPISRVIAVGAAANGKQFIFDSFFEKTMTRVMPTYSVPGLIDHF